MTDIIHIEDYFREANYQKDCQNIVNISPSVESLISEVNKDIQKQILNGIQQISSQKKPFKLIKYENKERIYTETVNMENQLRNIEKKKVRIKQNLQNLICAENDLSIDLNLSRVRYNKAHRQQKSIKSNTKERSNYTEDQKLRIKKLVQRNRKFEQDLTKKTVQLTENLKAQQKQKYQKIQQKKRKMKNRRRQKALKKMNMQQNKKEENHNKMKQWSETMKKLLKSKRLHQQMKEQWKIQENQEEQKKIQKIKIMRKNQQIDFSQIKEHQRRYNQTVLAQRQSRSKLFTTHPLNRSQSKINLSPSSPFLKKIFQEERQAKQSEEKKKKLLKELVDKRLSYAENVRKDYQPKHRQFNHSQQIKQTNKQNMSPNIKQLNVSQMYRQGVQFMRAANMQNSEKAKKFPKQQQINTNKKPQYQNYLAESRFKNGETSLKKKSDLQQIKKIMKFKKFTEEQKFMRAKLLTEKIEKQDYYPKQKVLVNSISAKLQILKQLAIQP